MKEYAEPVRRESLASSVISVLSEETLPRVGIINNDYISEIYRCHIQILDLMLQMRIQVLHSSPKHVFL